jgi:hypothetical protein
MNRRHFVQSTLAAAVAYALPAPRLYALDQAASQAAGGVAAVKLDGSATVIEQASLAELKASLRGPILLAGDPGYDAARRVLNESIDRHPALVVQPTGVADIRAAVDFARERELLLAVKCGGHSPSGKSTCEKGMQIDLSHFRGVRVDPQARRAYVSGGSLLGEVDHEAQALGLVTTCGTGLAHGRRRPDARRRLRPRRAALRPCARQREGRGHRHCRRPAAPRQRRRESGPCTGRCEVAAAISASSRTSSSPCTRCSARSSGATSSSRSRGRANCSSSTANTAGVRRTSSIPMPSWRRRWAASLACSSSTSAIRARRATRSAFLAPVRKLGTPLNDGIKAQDYVAIQRADDRTDPRNQGTYLTSGFIDGYTADLVKAIADGFRPDPARSTALFFQHSGGAIGRVAPDATAFPHRRSTHNMLAAVVWNLDSDRKPHVDWLKGYWSTLEKFTDGWYTNESGDESQQVRDANYQGNLPRLRVIKKKYDPANLFRLNANVQPA